MIRRVVVWILLSVFLLLAAGTVLLETSGGARLIQGYVLRELKSSGIVVNVQEIRGQLPEVMQLKGVEVHNVAGYTYFIDSLKLELSVLRILKKELAFRSVVVKGVRRQAEPRTAARTETEAPSILPLPVRISVQAFDVSQIEELPGTRLRGKLTVKQAIKLALEAHVDELAALQAPAGLSGPLEFSFSGKGTLDAWTGSASLQSQGWALRGQLEQLAGGPLELRELVGVHRDLSVKGTLQLDAHYAIEGGELQLTATHSQIFAKCSLTRQLEGLRVKGRWQWLTEHASGTWDGLFVNGVFTGSTEATGNYLHEPWVLTTGVVAQLNQEVRFTNATITSALITARGDVIVDSARIVTGTVHVERADLRLSGLEHLSGTASGECVLRNVAGQQAIQLTGIAQEVLWNGAYAKQIDFQTDFPNQLHLDAREMRYKHLKLDEATLDATRNGPFLLTARGTLRDPLTLALSGTWRAQDSGAALELQRLEGSAFNHTLALHQAAFLTWENDALSCSGLALGVGDGVVALDFTKSAASLRVQRLPLDVVGFSNELDLEASVQTEDGETRGHLQLQTAQGTLVGQLADERLTLKGELKGLVAVNADVPLELVLWPPRAHFPLDKRAEGRLKIHGQIEELLDFMDLGTHYLAGEWTSDLKLKNTLGHPRLEGFCELEDGRYENYLTGTSLTNIQANFLAEGDHLFLRSLSAQDEKKSGKLTATGDIHLLAAQRFPFVFDVAFDRLTIAQVDLVTAEAEGRVVVRGNLDGAEARGDVRILEADFAIPDKIPTPLPELQVVYKHGVEPVALPPVVKAPYPLRLALDVSAPGSVFVRGRGLSSEWKGDFQLGGTYTDIAAKGTLELLFGEFVFSGRTFTLTEGVLSFSGKSGEMPSLNLAGHMTERGVAITARLKGPLNKPQISFQSVPPLPFSSILSYLLFGKDISEIDAFQAIQLAGSVATIAGESGDVLEGTRRSLGVDRLRIVSTGSAEEGETIAIQVGKYVAKGVIVSFSQGADETSSNVSIEVDLKHGFVFQAETEQQQEQGKFTLKWNLNY